MDVSFQLYSARNVSDQYEFLKTLNSLGFTQVEGYDGVYKEAEKYRDAMDAVGIEMPSGHLALTDLETNFDGQIDLANRFGFRHIYVPYLAPEQRPTDSAGYVDIARRMTVLNEKVRDAGFVFGWHNHDFEMVPLADGGVPMEILLNESPDITWEADLAWVHYAGADPIEWMEKYGSRITSVHVKDIAVPGEKTDEDGWADVGEGVMDWKLLITKARSAAPGALEILEHDKPSDTTRFASKSFQNFIEY